MSIYHTNGPGVLNTNSLSSSSAAAAAASSQTPTTLTSMISGVFKECLTQVDTEIAAKTKELDGVNHEEKQISESQTAKVSDLTTEIAQLTAEQESKQKELAPLEKTFQDTKLSKADGLQKLITTMTALLGSISKEDEASYHAKIKKDLDTIEAPCIPLRGRITQLKAIIANKTTELETAKTANDCLDIIKSKQRVLNSELSQLNATQKTYTNGVGFLLSKSTINQDDAKVCSSLLQNKLNERIAKLKEYEATIVEEEGKIVGVLDSALSDVRSKIENVNQVLAVAKKEHESKVTCRTIIEQQECDAIEKFNKFTSQFFNLLLPMPKQIQAEHALREQFPKSLTHHYTLRKMCQNNEREIETISLRIAALTKELAGLQKEEKEITENIQSTISSLNSVLDSFKGTRDKVKNDVTLLSQAIDLLAKGQLVRTELPQPLKYSALSPSSNDSLLDDDIEAPVSQSVAPAASNGSQMEDGLKDEQAQIKTAAAAAAPRSPLATAAPQLPVPTVAPTSPTPTKKRKASDLTSTSTEQSDKAEKTAAAAALDFDDEDQFSYTPTAAAASSPRPAVKTGTKTANVVAKSRFKKAKSSESTTAAAAAGGAESDVKQKSASVPKMNSSGLNLDENYNDNYTIRPVVKELPDFPNNSLHHYFKTNPDLTVEEFKKYLNNFKSEAEIGRLMTTPHSNWMPYMVLAYSGSIEVLQYSLSTYVQTKYDPTTSRLFSTTSGWNVAQLIAQNPKMNNAEPEKLAKIFEYFVGKREDQTFTFLNLNGKTFDANAREVTIDPPLIIAATFNHDNIILALLQTGAFPNITNAKGNTALHIVCEDDENRDTAKILLKDYLINKQALTITNRKGQTPSQVASEFGATKIAAAITSMQGRDANLRKDSVKFYRNGQLSS